MYNSQYTADLIKKSLFDRKITAKSMCTECGLGVNSLSNIRRGDIKSVETFMVIADYLNCSVDYLLGRTDDPTNATIRGFNSLNSEGQNMVMEYIRILMNDDKYKKSDSAPQEHVLEIAAFGGKGTEGEQPHGAPEITGN